MEPHREVVNRFLVEVFNEILKTEEDCLSQGQFRGLSVREWHVIEAVCAVEESGESGRAAEIAESLRVTAGTLTAAVSVLERKGYLVRRRDGKDRRVVRICSTRRGREANALHKSFHMKMAAGVLGVLDEAEQMVLIRALQGVREFFDKERTNRYDTDFNR